MNRETAFRLSRGTQRWDARQTARAIAAAGARNRPGPGNLVPVREADPLHSIARALAVRDAGAVPLLSDERWLDAHWAQLARRAPAWRVPDGTAWAAFTSGSTGAPRVVTRSAASWETSFAAIDKLLDVRENDAIYAPVPVVSSMTVFQIAHARARGLEIVLPAGHSISAADLSRVRLAHVTPQGLSMIVTALEAGAESPLRTVLVGGQALPAALRARAQALGLRVLAYYGAAELSFVAIDEGDGLRPFPGVELAVRGNEGKPGTLWVRSPYLASGYAATENAGNAEATGPMRRDDGGWASAGDLATLHGEGDHARLTLHGRADGAILSAGATIVPGDVEMTMREIPGVRDAMALGLPNRHLGALPAIVLELDEAAPSLHALREAARERLPLAQRPRAWFRLAAFPRTPSGKPRRAEIIRAVTAGEAERLD